MTERALRVLTHFPAERIATLCEDIPGVEFIHVPGEGDIPDDLTGDVLLTWAWGAPNVAQLALRGVRWIHTIGTGVDRFPLDAVGDRGRWLLRFQSLHFIDRGIGVVVNAFLRLLERMTATQAGLE